MLVHGPTCLKGPRSRKRTQWRRPIETQDDVSFRADLVARIRRDPRAAFLVESGEKWAELCAVHLTGTIERVDDDGTKARIDAALDGKYAPFRTEREDMPAETAAHYTGRTFYRLVPDARILTWDNSRIALKSAP